jgi:phytanoyl-CoA hydroxylase
LNVFTSAELSQFARDGFVIARRLASRESCENMRAVAQRHLTGAIQPVEYEADVRYPGAPASRDAPGGRTVRRLLQAFARDAAYRDYATASPVATRLRQLLGERIEL